MHVVIVGGGLAGATTAVNLCKEATKARRASELQVTLVEPNEYVEVRWASVRALFDDTVLHACTIPLSDVLQPFCHIVTHKRSRATSIASHVVALDSGEHLTHDAVLIAIGMNVAHAPLNPTQSPNLFERRALLRAHGRTLVQGKKKKKKRVLVVGGGLVGVELAGDLRAYAEKDLEIVLVHAADRLTPLLSEAFSTLLLRELTRVGVRVVLDCRAQPLPNGDWRVANDVFTADDTHVVKTTGAISNMQPTLFDQLSPQCRAERHWIRTDPFGRALGHDNVFALGDCVESHDKRGVTILATTTTLAHNLWKNITAPSHSGQSAPCLRKLPQPHSIVVVTLGPAAGVAFTPLGPTTWVLPRLKNRDLFVSSATHALGL